MQGQDMCDSTCGCIRTLLTQSSLLFPCVPQIGVTQYKRTGHWEAHIW
jgi:hypothetical protein